jgi:hypothetical protein
VRRLSAACSRRILRRQGLRRECPAFLELNPLANGGAGAPKLFVDATQGIRIGE